MSEKSKFRVEITGFCDDDSFDGDTVLFMWCDYVRIFNPNHRQKLDNKGCTTVVRAECSGSTVSYFLVEDSCIEIDGEMVCL